MHGRYFNCQCGNITVQTVLPQSQQVWKQGRHANHTGKQSHLPKCVCVHVCEHVCVCVCTCVYVYVGMGKCMQRPEEDIWCLSLSTLFFWDKFSHWIWRLTGQQAPRIHLSLPPGPLPLVLGLQVCIAMHDFHIDARDLNSGSPVCTASHLTHLCARNKLLTTFVKTKRKHKLWTEKGSM